MSGAKLPPLSLAHPPAHRLAHPLAHRLAHPLAHRLARPLAHRLALVLAVELAVALGCSEALAAPGATTLLLHGHIYTGDPQRPWVAALALDADRISAVGSDATIAPLRRAKTAVIDLQGRTVIPGIVDSHMHLLYGAYALHGLNLSTPAASVTPDQPALLIARLREYAALHPADAILFARADFSTVPPTTPNAALLDRAVADRPLLVHNTSEHALWLNSAALALAGITAQPVADPDEERGVLRDASGRPSGVLLEAGMQLAARAVAGRLEHADLVSDADLPRFAALGVIADMQPSFCCSEDGLNIDPANAIVSDRWHSLAASGATLAFSSDWPCTWPPSAFVAIQEAVTRQIWRSADTANVAGEALDGAAQGGATPTGGVYTPAERIDVAAAVRAYTRGSAYAAFFDERVGTLEVGKLADLAVLSQDIFAIEPTTIGATRVTLTMVGGKIVYRGR